MQEYQIIGEPDPITDKRNKALGRLANWAQKKAEDQMMTVKTFWFPDYTIYLESPNEDPLALAFVKIAGSVEWEPDALKRLGRRSVPAANHALLSSRKNA